MMKLSTINYQLSTNGQRSVSNTYAQRYFVATLTVDSLLQVVCCTLNVAAGGIA
jgi:hypothetical protein